MNSRDNQNKLVLLLLVSVTFALWIGSKWWFGDTFADTYKYIAKASSLSATVLMGFTILLSTRIKILESLFGGLDKIYHLHKFAGKTSFYLILLHPIFLSFRALSSLNQYIRFWGLQSTMSLYSIGHSVGIITLALMTVLIALSLWIKLPYHLWKLTHEYFGVVYILTALHIILVNADIARYPLLGFWMYGWLAAGIMSFVYSRFLYTTFGPKFEYYVDSVDVLAQTIEITLQPKNPLKIMRFRPSQFVYLQFVSDTVSNEIHPYSIASAPDKHGVIKFGIKTLGDYTRTLVWLKENDKAHIYGPYGRFSESFLKTKRDCVFIGGGIGITPFLGMWDMGLNSDERVQYDEVSKIIDFHSDAIKNWKSPRMHLFYVVNEADEATFDNDIMKSAIKGQYNGFLPYKDRGHSYELYSSNQKGRITADYMQDKIPTLLQSDIFICGPQKFMDSIIDQLFIKGINRELIHTENFNLVNQHFQIPGLASRTKM